MHTLPINHNYSVNGTLYTGDNIYLQARYPLDQLNAAVENTNLTTGIKTVWVVISQSVGSCWDLSTVVNQQFFTEFASFFPNLGPKLGVVTTQADFQAIFGTTYQPVMGNGVMLELMLSDCKAPQDSNELFMGFNGWSNSTIHRYQCGVSDINGMGITGNLNYITEMSAYYLRE